MPNENTKLISGTRHIQYDSIFHHCCYPTFNFLNSCGLMISNYAGRLAHLKKRVSVFCLMPVIQQHTR